MTIETAISLMYTYGGPVVPYAVIALLTWQVMNRLVKPIVSPHKGKDGHYHDWRWRLARRGYIAYPVIIGALCAAVFSGLVPLYSIGAAASAQLVYAGLDFLAKKYGITLPSLPSRKSLTSPK